MNRNLSLSCCCHLCFKYLICCAFVLLRCPFPPFLFFWTTLHALTTTTTTHAMAAAGADRPVLLSSSCACSRVRIIVRGQLHQDQQQQQQQQQQQRLCSKASVVQCHCRECRKFHTSGCVRYFPLSSILENNNNDYNSGNNTNENDNIDIVLEQQQPKRQQKQQQQQQQQQKQPKQQEKDNAVLAIPHKCAEVGPVHRLVCRHCSSKLATIIVPSEATSNKEAPDWMKTIQQATTTLQKTSSLLWKQQLPSSQVLLNLGPLDEKETTSQILFHLLSKKWRQPSAITQWHMQSRASWLIQARPMQQRRGHNNKRPTQDFTVPSILTGSCACGQCRYQIRLPSMAAELQHCYCRLCRQFSGSAFQTWMPVERSDFQWMPSSCVRQPPRSSTQASPQKMTEIQGSSFEPPLVRTTPHGRRHICPTCHGVLTIAYDDQPDVVWPAAGGLDDDYDEPGLDDDNQKTNTDEAARTRTAPADTSQPNSRGNPTLIHLYRVCHICCAYCPPWYQLPKDGLERISEAC